ncbi:P-loop containing nucleoside triphosphate hydrolase protein [Spinellus fusiger]|nr:P-loop containing nucleoside triphosphate hydrolase protein [Spinellus fusiger]
MAVSDQQNAFTTTYLSESSKEYDKPTNATEIAISETSTLFHIDVVRKNILPLFRCFRCYRTCHIECLPEFIDKETRFPDMTKEEQVKMGRNMCLKTWKCPECIMYKKEVERILTMRSTATSTTIDTSMEKHTSSEYQTQTFECLIKWKNTSYRHLTWVSEKWIKGLAPAAYKSLLDHYRNEEYSGEEDVVVKDWMAVDRILDMNTESDQTLILAKYCGLPYDQACWDTPPPSDSDLYPFYKDALRRYSIRKAMVPPTKMQERVRQVKAVATKESYSKHELKKQPNIIKGGELMKHQLDGLNWLLYQWERNQPCILADDMGLGKTIQIIVFFYYLFKKFNIYPFFIVVPNSTLENWLREFSKWAPDMLAVPYQGSAKSRELTRKYEIFSQDYPHPKIKCHVVVLTYESALYDMSYFLKSAYWPAMVVDEAHRLKNNSSLLFQKLQSLNTDHKILLTGTPLQNNIRELINIMHFVDPIRFKDLKTLGEKYKELSHELVQELHDHLKPYFLRRTKKLALKDLPPKFEIIVPLSMTNLQKEVYKSILSNNIVSFASTSSQSAPKLQKKARSVLMELRKTLNHPYLIQDVEVDQPSAEATQRALIDACEKLKVLHQMIPKLQKDGHRLLIFSTLRLTLDVLEDYLKAQSYKFVRLDGSCSQLERVKAIDAFNAPNSDIPVFLLTTRAGGVGINLATADTVLVWDSDFNPHADLQAISRAYRIGQKNPVLVLKFMTRLSIEEKIVQLSKKKMVIDHLVVDKMDDTELEVDDIESILKFGAQTLFEGDDSKDISYDSAAIDKLLDRSRIVHDTSDTIEEDTNATGESKDKTMSFSFAKVWSATDGETELVGLQNDKPEDSDFWNRFLREKREEQDSLKLKNEELGRGARKRTRVVSSIFYFYFKYSLKTKTT